MHIKCVAKNVCTNVVFICVFLISYLVIKKENKQNNSVSAAVQISVRIPRQKGRSYANLAVLYFLFPKEEKQIYAIFRDYVFGMVLPLSRF